MPCEYIPCTVNNSHIVVELGRLQKDEQMYKAEGLVGRGEEMLWESKNEINSATQSKLRDRSERSLELNPDKSQNDFKYRVFGYRTLPGVFSALGDFEAIQEGESLPEHVMKTPQNRYREPRSQHCEPLRRKSTVTSSYRPVISAASSIQDLNRRRRSEGLLLPGQNYFRLVERQRDSECILGKRPSEKAETNIKALMQDSPVGEVTSIVTNNTRRASFNAMNSSVPASLTQPRQFHSLPRKLSLPVKDTRTETTMRDTQQRNSVATDSSYLRNFSVDNHTEVQWERLVARARSFQIIASKEPETVHLKKDLDDKTVEKIARTAGKLSGNNVEVYLDESEGTSDEENEAVNLKQLRKDSGERKISLEKKPYSVKDMEDDKESKENQNEKDLNSQLTEEEVTKTDHVDTVVKDKFNELGEMHPKNTNYRRFSVASLRPHEVKEKMSGYSTHGALEYAKMLLGKAQTEGKLKSKKVRLEDMSRALKMVLEELNRIELPDRDLVSLFISLRAKIVNLRAELKSDEIQINDNEANVQESVESTVRKVSSMPRTLSTNNAATAVHSRRFSWC